MNPLANSKTVYAVVATNVTAAATGTATIDRLGFDHVSLDLIMGTANVVSNKPTVLKLAHSDITDATGFSDLTPFVGGTAFTIPNALTSADNIYRFEVDMRNRKRYLKFSVSPATTQDTRYLARLGRAGEAADASATKAGVSLIVSG